MENGARLGLGTEERMSLNIIQCIVVAGYS